MIDKSIIGRRGPQFTCIVEAGKLKEYAAAVNETSDCFWSDDDPEGLLAPPTFTHVFRSGKAELLFSSGVDAAKILQGEHEITYHRPLRAGDEITYHLEIVDYFEKVGNRSGPMDIIVVQTILKNKSGEPVQTIRQTFVHQR